MSKEKNIADAVFNMLKAYNQSAMLCLKQKKVREAIKIFNDSLKLQELFRVKKGIAETHYNIANAYMLIGESAEARKHLETSRVVFEELRSDKDLFNVDLTLGQIALSEKKEDEAMSHFTNCSKSELFKSNRQFLEVFHKLCVAKGDTKKAKEIEALLKSK